MIRSDFGSKQKLNKKLIGVKKLRTTNFQICVLNILNRIYIFDVVIYSERHSIINIAIFF